MKSVCLMRLIKNGLNIKRQQPTPVVYKEIKLEMWLQDGYTSGKFRVVVELKVVDEFKSAFMKLQILTYEVFKTNLLAMINFNVTI